MFNKTAVDWVSIEYLITLTVVLTDDGKRSMLTEMHCVNKTNDYSGCMLRMTTSLEFCPLTI